VPLLVVGSSRHMHAGWIELSCMFPNRVGGIAVPGHREARHAGGGRGVALVASPAELAACAAEPDLLVQDYLPGDEYSIDVLADHLGRVHACVPRVRVRATRGHRWPATRCAIATRAIRRLVVEVLAFPSSRTSRSAAMSMDARRCSRSTAGPRHAGAHGGRRGDMASMAVMHCEAGPFPQASSIVRSP